ncbi:MAG: T9SS type A sorting domain-containing protein [Bacteroidia bacterium]|nr:T9SS type A sorting domain-containing protein [Bacteroidia bacterium]
MKKYTNHFYKPLCLFLIGMLCTVFAFGQNVNVTGALAGNGTYATLGAAFTAINVAGNNGSGPISVSIVANTTESATATLGAITWASVTVTATTPVTVTGNITGAIIRLNGADNVTIDGRIGGVGRNISVINSSTATATAAFWLSSLGAGAGATNNTIRNLEIACGATQNTTTNSTFGILMGGTTIGISATGGDDNDNNSFVDNRIIRCRYGIGTRGAAATNLNQNTIITDNLIGPTAFGADEIGQNGIFVQFENLCTISRNTVQFIGHDFANSISAFFDKAGIAIGVNSWSNLTTTTASSSNISCTRNLVHDVCDERTNSAVGIIVGTTLSGPKTLNLIANNMIYNVRCNGTTGDQGAGIGHCGGPGDQIVFNSIYLTGDVDPTGTTTATTNPIIAGISKHVAAAADTAVFIKNNAIYVNISSNTTTLLKAPIIAPAAGYAYGSGGLNNNDYYIPSTANGHVIGVAGTGTTSFATLPLWQAVYTPAQDAASISVDPSFTSTTDLHINVSSPAVNNLAVPLAAVINDFDNDTRSLTTPDIGADEYSPLVCSGTPTPGSIAPVSSSICTNGAGVTLTLSGNTVGAGISIEWDSSTVSGGPYFTIPGATTSTYFAKPGSTTYYKVRVLCSNSGLADSTTQVTVTVNTPPTVTVSPTSDTICNPGGAPISLTASGASTYTWAPAAGLSATTGASVNATPSATTTYTVTGTDANGCTATATAIITSGSNPVVSASATPASVCSGGNSQLAATASVPWTTPLVNTYGFAGSSGTYTAISGTAVTFGSQDDGYTGNLPIGFTFNYNGANQTVFAVSPNGWVQLGQTGSSSTGFFSNALASNALFIAPLWDDNNITGGNVQYSTSGTAPNRVLTVQWTALHTGSSGSTTNPTIDMQVKLYEGSNVVELLYGSTSGALVGTTASIGISGASGNYLSVTPLSPANTSTVSSATENTTISSAANFPSGTIYTFTPAGAPTLSYSWSPATFLSSTTISNPVATAVTATTTYTVTVQSNLGCTTTATASIAVEPPATANAGADIAGCNCCATTYTVTGAIGGSATSAAWSTNNGGGSFNTVTWDGLGQVYTPGGSDLTGIFPKFINIILTTDDPAGACTAASDTLVITIHQVPSLVTTPAVLCTGGSLDLNAHVSDGNSTTGTLAYYLTYSNAQTETGAISATVSSTGTYYVRKNTATTPACLDIDSITVTASTIAAGESHTNILCTGAATGTIDVTVTPGTAPYTFAWSDSNTNEDRTGLTAGTYTVTVTDANGCTATVSATLTEPAAAVSANCTGTNVSCFGGNNGTASVLAGGGVSPYTYAWSNGSTDASITGLTANTYTVTVTDANGCTVTCAYVVTEPSAVVAACSGTNVDCFGNSTGSASVLASGGTASYTYLWSTSASTSTITGLAANTYTVTVTDGNGCTASCNYVVTQPVALGAVCSGTNVNCFGNSTGSASVAASDGTAPYSYMWSNGATDASITGLAANTYTVTVTDANGCTISCGYTVMQPATALAVVCSGNNVSCNGGSNGSASVLASDGTAPYTYAWSNGSTDASITGLTANTYTVTVTDANGCTLSCNYAVTEPASVTANCSVTSPITIAGNDGQVTVVAGGGTSPYSYLWSNGQTTATATGLSDGIYTVTVTDANNCTSTCSVTLPAFLPLSATCSNTTVSCNGGNDGTATVLAAGGSSPYAYLWSTGATTASIAGLTANTYTVTVTDNIGTTASCQTTVAEPAVLTATMSSTNVTCAGGNDGTATVLAGGGTSPYTYLWSNSQTNATATGLVTATYTVTVTDANGCTVSNSILVNDNPVVVVTATASPDTICNGSSSILTGSGAVTYTWMPGSLSGTTVSVSPTANTTYTVTGADANGCTATATVSVVVEPAPTVNAGADITVCGCCNALVLLNGAIGGTASSATWSVIPNPGDAYLGAGVLSNANSLSTATYAPAAADAGRQVTIVLTTDDPAGVCAPATDTVVITVTQCPDYTVSNDTLCAPGSASFDLNTLITSNNAVISTVTYHSTLADAQSGSNALTNPVAIAATTTYYLRAATAGSPICKDIDSIEVVVLTPVVATASADVFICEGQSTTLSVSASGGMPTPDYTYAWSPAVGLDNTTAASVNANPTVTTNYTVVVTDRNGCTAVDSVLVTVGLVPSVALVQDSVTCNGQSNGSIQATGTGSSGTYNFSINPDPNSQSFANTAGPVTFTNLPAGVYTVTIADFSNGCTSTSSIEVLQPNALIGNASVSDSVSCNGMSDGAVTANPTGGTGGYTYSWTNSSNINVGTTQTVTGLPGDVYTVTVTDINGCTVTSSVNLINPAVISITLDNVVHVQCFGYATGSIDLGVAGGSIPYSYLWSNGATTEDLNGLVAGTYTLTVTDLYGCTETFSTVITQNPQLIVGTSQSNVTCHNGSDGSATVSVSGGIGGYSYIWDNGDTTPTGFNFAAGTHTVTITDSSGTPGCDTTITFLITQPSLLDATASVTNLNCHGASNGVATVFPTGGTPPYTYSWTSIPVQTTATATGLPAGVYTCNILDSLGCTKDVIVEITSPDSLYFDNTITHVLCNGGNTGEITVSVNGGTPGFTYLWSNGETTATIQNLVAGTYTLTVTDANNCQVIGSVTVTEPTAISLSTSFVSPLCFGGNNGTATVNASGGTTPYTYSWSTLPAQTAATATGLSAGAYSVVVVDANGCTASADVTITQPDSIALNGNITHVLCNGGNNGMIDIIPTGGIAPYSVIWSNGSTNTTVSGLTAGNYTATVTDANNCTRVETFIVTEPAAIVIGGTINNATCFGNSNGSIISSVTGGVSPYVYNWSTGATTANVSGLAAGVYTVIVIDANSCTASMQFTVAEPAELSCVCNANITNVSCAGGADGSVTALPSGGTAPYSYSWIRISPTVSGVLATTQTISGLTAGVYEVTITDANGCTKVGTAVITEPAPLTVFAAPFNVACNGNSSGTATATASGGTLPYTYSWNTSPVQTSNIATGLGAGIYTVVVTDANGCTVSTTVTITQPTAIATTMKKTNVSCRNGSNGTAQVLASGGTPGYTYLWNNGATTAYITGLTAGTYTVTVTDANGCTVTNSINVTQPPALTALYTVTRPSCFGYNNGTIDVTVTGGTAPYTYVWSIGATTQDLVGVVSAGAYSVIILDSKGCTILANIFVTQPNVLVLSSTQSNVSCNGGADGKSTVNHSGGTAPFTYLWSNGSTSKTATGLAAGTYTVTVTDSKGCTASLNINITEPSVLSCTTTMIDAVLCNGGNDGKASVTPVGGTPGYSYVWNTTPIKTSGTVSNLQAGTYTVIVTDRKGCTTSCTVTITQPTALTATTSASAASCNGGSDGTASVVANNGTPGYTYLWNTGASATTASISGLTAGTYTVTVTDANGCTKTATAVVTQPTAITASASATNVACNGGNTGTVTAVASGGTGALSYTLNPGAVTNGTGLFTGLVAGTYSVTITDANGCTTSVSGINITESTALVMGALSNTSVSCNGGANGTATAGIVSGGTMPYTYLWNSTPVQLTATATGLPAGTFTVTVTDANGCTVSGNTTITEPATALTATISNVINIPCSGGNTGSAQVTGNGGTVPYTYLWSNGQTTDIVTGLLAGTYGVMVTDANGCVASATVVISQPAAFMASANVTHVACNGDTTGSINVIISGGTAPYTYVLGLSSNSTGIFTGLTAGTYTVNVSDAGGCTTSVTVTVTEPAALIANTTAIDVNCNGGNNGIVAVYVTGGVTPYTYLWSNGATGQNAGGLSANTYTVTVTDANGCTITRTAVVAEPTVLVGVGTQVDVNCAGDNTGTATAVVSGGAAPYFYMWNDGQMTVTATGLAAGSYTVIVTDYNGCTTAINYTITEPLPISANEVIVNPTCFGNNGIVTVSPTGGPVAGTYSYTWLNDTSNHTNVGTFSGNVNSICVIITKNGCAETKCFTVVSPTALLVTTSNVNPLCNDSANGSITAAVVGGTAAYSYLWSDGSTDASLTNLSAGTYTLTVTDANGCTNVSTVTLTEPATLTATVTTGDATCGNDNGTAMATVTGGTAPYTYDWDGYGTWSNVSGLPVGSYTLTVSDANGCGPVLVPFTINSAAALTCATTTTNVTCAGYHNGTATVTAAGGTGSYTYLWNSTPAQTTATATGLAAGTYEVKVIDSLGCISICSVDVIEPTPLAYFTNQTNVTCSGGNSGSAVINAFGGVPYTVGNSYSYLWSNGQTTMIATGLSSGTYVFTITDSLGCSVTGAVGITQPVVINCNTNSTPATCGQADGTAIVNVIGGQAPYSYNWNTVPAQTNAIANSLTAGTYTVTVTDANGCASSCTVTVYQVTDMNFVLTSVPAACNGGNGSLNIFGFSGGTAPFGYLWSNGDTNAGLSAVAGAYTVTVTDANGCTQTASGSIAEPAAIVITSNVTNVSCSGNTDGMACVVATGGAGNYSFSWNTGATAACINNVAAGTYTVTATDANGCTTSANIIVGAPVALDTISTANTPASCGLANGTGTVVITGGTAPYTYAWTTNPVQTTATATGLMAGNNFVVVTDANGCQLTVCVTVATQGGIAASLNSPVYAGGVNIRCNGGSDGSVNLTVSGTGPHTYAWSNGATTEDIFGLTAGTYTVTVTNGVCTATSSITLTEAPVLTLATTQIDVSCNGSSSGSATAIPSGGTAPYTYSWNTVPVQTNATATGLVAGVYTVTVGDANGCTITASVTLTQPASPLAITATSVNPTCNGSNNGSIDITVTGGTAPYSYLWTDGAVTEDRTNIITGSHTVTVTDANGCVVSLCVVLTAPTQLQVTMSKTNVSCSGGVGGSACTTPVGGTAPYTYLWNTGATTSCINSLAAGTYTATVTDANGCTVVGAVVVSQPVIMVLSITKTNVTVFGGNNGTATVTVLSGGTAPFTYSWNTTPIKTTAAVTGLTAGTYQVTVTDALGCIQTASVVITQPNYFCNPITRPWRTESIVTWGVTPNGNPSQSGQYLTNNFAAAFPSSLVIGGGPCVGSRTLTLSNANAVRNFLNGQPNTVSNVLAANLVNPTSGSYQNKLAAQLVALTLNVYFDAYDPNFAITTTVPLGSAIISGMTGGSAVFNGMTVNQFLSEANKRLGGCVAAPVASPTTWANAAETINLAYLGGAAINTGLLSCPFGNNKVAIETAATWNVSAYPNPSNGIVNVAFNAFVDAEINITVLDLSGRDVWSTTEHAFTGDNTRTYDLSQLPKGVYMMRLSLDDHFKVIRLVIH